MRTVRTYQNGYTIACDDTTDLYHCLNNGAHMQKADGKPAAYKNLTVAEKFIKAHGALEIEKPKTQAWTPPTPATIPPLAEQLAALTADAPRFVLIEAGYGYYHEQGYACYDRQEQEIVCPHTYNGWNFVTQSRAEAEAEVAYRQEHPPEKIEPDTAILNILVEAEEAWENRFSQPLPEPAPTDKTEVVIDTKEQVGSVIEFQGKWWLVTQSEFISESEAADLEDGFDLFLLPGWHTTLVRLDPAVMTVLAEQYQDGQAQFPSRDTVKFPDEEQAIKLTDLAYSKEIGLYDKTKVSW